jgi:hypothetical protein
MDRYYYPLRRNAKSAREMRLIDMALQAHQWLLVAEKNLDK